MSLVYDLSLLAVLLMSVHLVFDYLLYFLLMYVIINLLTILYSLHNTLFTPLHPLQPLHQQPHLLPNTTPLLNLHLNQPPNSLNTTLQFLIIQSNHLYLFLIYFT